MSLDMNSTIEAQQLGGKYTPEINSWSFCYILYPIYPQNETFNTSLLLQKVPLIKGARTFLINVY